MILTQTSLGNKRTRSVSHDPDSLDNQGGNIRGSSHVLSSYSNICLRLPLTYHHVFLPPRYPLPGQKEIRFAIGWLQKL